MTTFYANCHTPDNYDQDRRIQGLGGSFGWLDIDTIIYMIDVQYHTFYTQPAFGTGQKIVTAIHPRSLRKYLKTIADGVEPNNILSLPHCPR